MTPSTPASRSARTCAPMSPSAPGSSLLRRWVGRKRFSARTVQTWTVSPRRCASRTRVDGRSVAPAASRGSTSEWCGPMPSAYSSMRSRASGVGSSPGPSSCTTGSRVRAARRRRTAASNDIRVTRAHGWSRPWWARSRSSGTSRASPRASWCAASLSSSITPTGRPRRADSSRTIASTSSSVATPSLPSYAALRGRVAGIRSRAARVRSSASVRSWTNQPCCSTPSTTTVRRRCASAARDATSVVVLSSRS